MIWLFLLILSTPNSLFPTKFAANPKPPANLTTATQKRLMAKKENQHTVVKDVLKRFDLNEIALNKKLDFSNKKLSKLTDQEFSIFCWQAAKRLSPETADFTSTILGRLSPENWINFCWLLEQLKNLTSLNLTATHLYLLDDICWKNLLRVLERSPNITELHLGSNGLKFFNSKVRPGKPNYSGNHRDDLMSIGFEPDYGEEVWTRPSSN
jgi:hypothetical protein